VGNGDDREREGPGKQTRSHAAGRHAHIRLEDSVQYLCRILCVFEDLFRGITADDLRGKFVSGLVFSGLPPERDCSFCFDQALRTVEGRGLVSHKDHGWGYEEFRLYKLTPAGDRLATDVEPVQWENGQRERRTSGKRKPKPQRTGGCSAAHHAAQYSGKTWRETAEIDRSGGDASTGDERPETISFLAKTQEKQGKTKRRARDSRRGIPEVLAHTWFSSLSRF
jgi:hypothetical protein